MGYGVGFFKCNRCFGQGPYSSVMENEVENMRINTVETDEGKREEEFQLIFHLQGFACKR